MIKIYFRNDEDILTLPVNPPKLEIIRDGNNLRREIVSIGEINIIRTPKLVEITLEGIFPANINSPLINGALSEKQYRSPTACIKFFEDVRDLKKPIIMTSSEIDFKLANTEGLVAIDDFSYYKEGGDEDVYYTLKLCEYKKYIAFIDPNDKGKYEALNMEGALVSKYTESNRYSGKIIPKTYTVKSGDTLWAIAKMQLGDGNKYKMLATLNKISDPNKVKVGQVLRLS